jgi:hypothetical protein
VVVVLKAAISLFRRRKTEPRTNSIHFLDEDLALVSASGIPEGLATRLPATEGQQNKRSNK